MTSVKESWNNPPRPGLKRRDSKSQEDKDGKEDSGTRDAPDTQRDNIAIINPRLSTNRTEGVKQKDKDSTRIPRTEEVSRNSKRRSQDRKDRRAQEGGDKRLENHRRTDNLHNTREEDNKSKDHQRR